MWNDSVGMFFDYDSHLGEQSTYESVTTFYAMWAGIATKEQAARIVHVGLQKFEAQGGLVTGTEESRGHINLTRPNRQWDYPYGWAPLQIVAWRGLTEYGYTDIARRLAYRWLYMITVRRHSE
jgi:alpha,alpha-trehalase